MFKLFHTSVHFSNMKFRLAVLLTRRSHRYFSSVASFCLIMISIIIYSRLLMNKLTLLLLTGAALAGGGVCLLRLAWAGRQRSLALNLLAWSVLSVGLLLGALAAGAWGFSVSSLVAMACAFILLARAGFTAPPDKTNPSARRAHILPDKGEALHLGRRFGTFALSVPGALVASVLMAIAVRTLVSWAGWQEANSTVLALFLMPLLWAGLMFALLINSRRTSQLALLGLPAAVSGIIILAGVSA
jgi:hypothetical protein